MVARSATTASTGGVEAVYAENVWLSQKMMAQLYDFEVPTINYHPKKVFEDNELEEASVVRIFRIAAPMARARLGRDDDDGDDDDDDPRSRR